MPTGRHSLPTLAEFMAVVEQGGAKLQNIETLFQQRGYSLDKHGLSRCLFDLLNQAESRGWLWVGSAGDIKSTGEWPGLKDLLNALGISLQQWASMNIDKGLWVEPVFGKPKTLTSSDVFDLFVLMPFTEELVPVYEDHIKKIAAELDLRVKRGDDFFTSDHVMHDIWAAIFNTRVIVADCTGRNPNVFYEIGVAHTIGKPVILVTQDIDDIPFDIRHIRFLKYQLTPRGMSKFEKDLRLTIQGILNNT